jgi:hypothetical protein
MADWNKRISKAAKDELQPGEEIVAAVFLQPAGTMGQAVARGAGGAVAKAVIAGRGGDGGQTAVDGAIAREFHDVATVLGLTQHRLLVFGYSSLTGKPKGFKHSLPAHALRSVSVEKQKATYRFQMAFEDGSSCLFEAPRLGNDPEAFAAIVNAD